MLLPCAPSRPDEGPPPRPDAEGKTKMPVRITPYTDIRRQTICLCMHTGLFRVA